MLVGSEHVSSSPFLAEAVFLRFEPCREAAELSVTSFRVELLFFFFCAAGANSHHRDVDEG